MLGHIPCYHEIHLRRKTIKTVIRMQTEMKSPTAITATRICLRVGAMMMKRACITTAQDNSPEIGRFLQTNPIGYIGGINLYTYCGNNPANFSDPFGLYKMQWGWWDFSEQEKAMITNSFQRVKNRSAIYQYSIVRLKTIDI